MENTMNTMTIVQDVEGQLPTHVVELPRLVDASTRGGAATRSSASTTIDAFPGTTAWGPPT